MSEIYVPIKYTPKNTEIAIEMKSVKIFDTYNSKGNEKKIVDKGGLVNTLI